MRRIKLLLMLALLCVGVGSVWAQTWNDGVLQYTVTNTSQRTCSVRLYLGKTMEVIDTVAYSSEPSKLKNLQIYNDNRDAYDSDAAYYAAAPANSVFTGLVNEGEDEDDNTKFIRIKNLYDTESANVGKTGWAERYYYARIRKAMHYSDAEEVVIPATVTYNGETYRVTSIPKEGFNYKHRYYLVRDYCDEGKSITTKNYWGSAVSNRYLKKVTFAAESNMEEIGYEAFMACIELTDITIPKSVKTFEAHSSGNGYQFEMCVKLASFTFQAPAQLKVIPRYCFLGCRSLASLEVPNSVTKIDNYALAYNERLTRITLSQNLKTIGTHFLCGASSLTELTIPASVETITGSILHGCESIRSVTLLGKPADFKEDKNSTPFEYNHYFCREPVNQCSFYVPEEWMNDYRKHDLWRLIADMSLQDGSPIVGGNTVDDGDGRSHTSHDNVLKKLPGADREFTPGQWATAVFPNGVDNVAKYFGTGTKWAVMTKAAAAVFVEETQHWTYDLTFEVQEGNNIDAGKCVMIKPTGTGVTLTEGKISKQMWQTSQETDDAFRAEMSRDHATTVTASDGAVVAMKGQYVDYYPLKYQFYFKSFSQADDQGNVGEFRHVRNIDNLSIKVGATRTYWDLNIDGVRVGNTGAKAVGFLDGVTNGIGSLRTDNIDIRIEGIYDVNGRRLDVDPSELPAGMYIVNGKKIAVK